MFPGSALSINKPSGISLLLISVLAVSNKVTRPAFNKGKAQPWRAGDFELRVDKRLEDVAGNSIARVFDTDRDRAAGPVDSAPSEGTVTVPFRVGSR